MNWKKFSSVFLLAIPIAILILLFSQRSNLQNYISKEIKAQVSESSSNIIGTRIDSLYNYSKNGQRFNTTLLEIGAVGCTACKQMELVLEEIRNTYPNEVNVIFINILKSDNQDVMKYYGVSSIPTQVLLDSTGKEYYRHSGYINSKDLSAHFN